MPLKDALSFKQGVRLRDSHGIYRVLNGHVSNRRELGTGGKLAAGDHAPNLVDELAIDWHAGVRI